ncbi:MAG: 3-oxoacyl-ACP reductase FabG [Desulfobacteraceae bacterium]|jgi:NAD(P)-dependent dehydrogenase (short-subunit alcohol dehydrogenase family)|nr:MAG: 3-oxoacyl-ACP reductase FabG [Desulfobacteraceae bacterium]
MRLKGRVAIVTGGAKGLGRAFALKLAEEGARVMVVTRKDMANLEKTVQQIKDLGGEAALFQADVARETDMLNMAEATNKAFGRIDVLINNAAIYDGIKRKPFYEIDPDEWDLVMTVNVKGAFLAARAVFPYMKAQGYGKIVNLSSEVFYTGSNGFAHYVASKGGIIGLTRALAVELGPHNICINCVAPGFTDTEASRGLADVTKYDTSKTPLRRLERPEDLTGAALFLASPESDFITGQTILVDGGRAMH